MRTQSTIRQFGDILSSIPKDNDDSWHQARLVMLKQVEDELLQDCERISGMIQETRHKIDSHLHKDQDFQGCLLGTVDDYLL